MDDQITYQQAVEYFGSGAELAKRLGIKPQAVYQWKNRVPPLRLYQIMEIIKDDQNDGAGVEVGLGRNSVGEKSHGQTIKAGN